MDNTDELPAVLFLLMQVSEGNNNTPQKQKRTAELTQ